MKNNLLEVLDEYNINYYLNDRIIVINNKHMITDFDDVCIYGDNPIINFNHVIYNVDSNSLMCYRKFQDFGYRDAIDEPLDKVFIGIINLN